MTAWFTDKYKWANTQNKKVVAFVCKYDVTSSISQGVWQNGGIMSFAQLFPFLLQTPWDVKMF